jgi:hypothetical protein
VSCKDRGLYETYDSHSEFKEKFYHHLQLKVNEHNIFFSEDEEPIQEVIYTSNTQLPQIGEEARILLKEASQDNHGTILYVRTLGDTDIQTNGKNLIPEHNQRIVAQWESALNELLNNDLIVERGQKGEVFQVTNLGYQIADMIEI